MPNADLLEFSNERAPSELHLCSEANMVDCSHEANKVRQYLRQFLSISVQISNEDEHQNLPSLAAPNCAYLIGRLISNYYRNFKTLSMIFIAAPKVALNIFGLGLGLFAG